MKVVGAATFLFSLSDANRVKHDSVIENDSSSRFFENCEELESIFHTRVSNVQDLQEQYADSTEMSAVTRARFTMRALGAVRTLRRSRGCSWVEYGDTEDIEQVHGLVHSVLDGNPCKDAALSALSAPAPEENQLQPLQQAVQILYSDTCELPTEGTVQNQVIDLDEEDAEVSQRLVDAEQQAQDSVDDLMDEAAENQASSLMQTEGMFRSVSRMLGVVFLTILFLLSCASVGALIGGIIGFLLLIFPCSFVIQGSGAMACLGLPALVGLPTAGYGLVRCGLRLAEAQGNFTKAVRGS